jgi:hypothetical protein
MADQAVNAKRVEVVDLGSGEEHFEDTVDTEGAAGFGKACQDGQ